MVRLRVTLYMDPEDILAMDDTVSVIVLGRLIRMSTATLMATPF